MFFGLRKYPTPVLKPLAPFIAGSIVVYYGVSKIQDAAVATEPHKSSPQNPYISQVNNKH
ncbi:ATP synthase subunit J, mitochondrial [Wallemia mellicola CBS 633.66]|uniref:ATP synthase subunit J, mitochondrial n=1 Tax=Wallemia mellicola (strain ATCC MYA-4683 / CBS 633.66) TaxID=671144 RepID=I4YH50_WALMC|nr:ATP synthase subunit J, mitochondrial [Wallemia mellicola CBS 633.66]EIM23292.1 ATP synthase subunit J, mitochondrial [Wallemia mellicola CBS 633.66]|eukprot:XP_006956680.1 ATP synthase subunit J, mitochondrial [Wallemia mellicola CBS 633.66]